ncbi:MAG: hypothetical protein M0D55_01065 [Elusimicrobiota bacterium]|nr:MAG: hypothetical protein M0D55_01065 [Elusimicrobiota bacterium]
MRLAAALLLAAPCAALSPETGLSTKTEAEFARIEASASASPTARRLLAATRGVPRREARHTGLRDPIVARGGDKPELVFDAARLEGVTEIEAELLLMLNLARAELAFPIPVVEAEQAAWQKALLFAAERGAQDKAFGERLAELVRVQGARARSIERTALTPKTPWEPSEIPVLALPNAFLDRAGLLLHELEADPQRFYRTLETGTAWPPGTVRLSEVEDLFALRAKELAALTRPPEGPYATLGGRRYPAPLVRAAFLLKGTGKVESLRESLEAYDTVGLASARIAINRWRRAVPKK